MNADDGLDHFGIVAEGETRPFLGQAPGAQIGVPRQPAEAIQVRHREVIARPVLFEPHVGNSHEAAGGPVEDLARHQRLHRCWGGGCVHVEIECLLPHGRQEDRVPGLPHVLLGDLQFDRLVGLFERAKQRGSGLAHLEIDGAVLDLDDDVVVELAVELP